MGNLFNWSRTAAATACVGSALMAGSAHAVIIYSGPVNLVIPNNSIGLYLNVLDRSSYTGPNTFPTLPGPGANYDINVFGTTTWSFFSSGTSGQSAPTVPASSKGYVSASVSGAVLSLAQGTLISGASVFNTGAPSGSGVSTGAPSIIGFRFRNEGANLASDADDTVHFGWARMVLTGGVPGTLVDYAFESVPNAGIQAGVVPEPAAWMLMAAGVAGLAARRRMRAG